MTDRIDEILGPIEVSVTGGPTSDSYLARNLEKIKQEVNATNGKIINVEAESANQISNLPSLSVEAYKAKLVVIRNEGSLENSDPIVTARPVQLLRLDDRNALPSNKMVDLVRFRTRGKGKRKLAA